MVKAKIIEITQEELKSVLDYDKDTGVFIWKVGNRRRVKAGDIAGYLNQQGYWVIRYSKENYYAHRLAYLYVNGSIPEGKSLDHIDTVKTNNKLANLRICTPTENGMNVGIRKNNTSGFKGVRWHKKAQKWEAFAWLSGKRYYLGYFDIKEDAALARNAFCALHHGEFYRDTTHNDKKIFPTHTGGS